CSGADDIHIDVGVRGFGVSKIEDRRAFDDADAHRRDLAHYRIGLDRSLLDELASCESMCDVRTGDRGAPRAAVRLDNGAIDTYLSLAKKFVVDDRSQR